jgi:DNA replication and repair protein RecF
LDAWDEQLVRFGSEIIAARVQLVEDLTPHLQAAYQAITARNNRVSLSYESSILGDTLDAEDAANLPTLETSDREQIATNFREKLTQLRKKELERGLTLVGPQRDELQIQLGDLPAKGYASHGESWSLALALRLGGAELIRAQSSVGDPILILDDVFAELDDERRRRLVEIIGRFEQVLVTAAAVEDIPEDLKAQRFIVSEGVVASG